MAVGKEADVADAMKTAGHGVLQEPTDELVGGERHHLGFAVLTVKVGDERRATFRRPVSRRPFPNRTCAFRYASGSPEDKAKSGVLIHPRRYRRIGIQLSRYCSCLPSRQSFLVGRR
jgi:hypothetical protein